MSLCNLLPEAKDGDMLSSVEQSILSQLLEQSENTTGQAIRSGSPEIMENEQETNIITQSTSKPQEALLSAIDSLQATLDAAKKPAKSGVSTVSCNIYTRGNTNWYSHTWDQKITLGEIIVNMEVLHPMSHFRQMTMKLPLPQNHPLCQLMMQTIKETLTKRKHATKTGVNRGPGDTAGQYGKRFKKFCQDQ